jgi:hypothetical protein
MVALVYLAPLPAKAALVVAEWLVDACVAAAPDQTFQTGCTASSGGVFVSDAFMYPPPPPPPTVLPRPVVAASIGSETASAYQSAGGFNGASSGIHGSASSGFERGTTASARLQLTLYNDGTVPIPLSFRMLILGGHLALRTDNFVAEGEDVPIAEVNASLSSTVPGHEGIVWRYNAVLSNRNSELLIGLADSGSFDPQGQGKPVPTVTATRGSDAASGTIFSESTVTLAPFVATFDLGELPGLTAAKVVYNVRARTYTGEPSALGAFDPASATMLASASIADPFGLDADLVPGPFSGDAIFINGIALNALVPVPESEVYLLMSVGLILIGALRARRVPRRERR